MITGIETALARALAAFILLSATALASASERKPDSRWGIEQLMEALRQVKSAHAKFVERKHLALLKAPLDSSGTLVYRAPDHLEKHTLRPSPESLILDGDRVTLEKLEGGPQRILQLEQYPVLRAFVESMRSTLAGDLATLRRYYDVDLAGTEARWRLTLRPRDPGMRDVVTEIRIEGRSRSITAVTVLETGGDRSTMTLSESAS